MAWTVQWIEQASATLSRNDIQRFIDAWNWESSRILQIVQIQIYYFSAKHFHKMSRTRTIWYCY